MKIKIYFWTILNRMIIFSNVFFETRVQPHFWILIYDVMHFQFVFFQPWNSIFFPENLTQDEMQKHIFLRWRCNASTFHCCDFQVHFNTYHFRSCKINILVICGLNCITIKSGVVELVVLFNSKFLCMVFTIDQKYFFEKLKITV